MKFTQFMDFPGVCVCFIINFAYLCIYGFFQEKKFRLFFSFISTRKANNSGRMNSTEINSKYNVEREALQSSRITTNCGIVNILQKKKKQN